MNEILRRALRCQSGQALAETALFLPLASLGLFGLIYFTRVGILQERVQYAVRYSTEVAAPTGGLQAMYTALYTATQNGGAMPAPQGADCSAGIAAAAAAALLGNEAGPLPTSTAQPYFRSDGAVTATCTEGTATLKNSGNPFIAMQYATTRTTSIAGSITGPGFLQRLLPGSFAVQAQRSVLAPAPPAVILYCSPKITPNVTKALGQAYAGITGPGANPHAC